ncbi:MAG TPA: endonuclease III [Gammaproteobacteria bacterium]|nr:endonuclease III [Gammaproteobacteria bacterium]HIM05749.1 endonuclease III [Gammaproteobacteria bacterium]
MNPVKRKQIFKILAGAHGKPSTELNFRSNFELLVAVILSAQATDISVNKATDTLYRKANTPQAFLNLGLTSLKRHIRTIGLYNTKAQNIIKTCRMLIDLHNGQVPSAREALEALPGVGRKTANVVLNTAFGEPTIAVDTHIFRVANRTGLGPGKTVLKVEQKLLKFTPERYLKDAHHLLILHGRYTCIARTPRCPVCVIREFCDYRPKTREPE